MKKFIYGLIYTIIIVSSAVLLNWVAKSTFYSDYILSWELWLYAIPVIMTPKVIENVKAFNSIEPKDKHISLFTLDRTSSLYYIWRYKFHVLAVSAFFKIYISPKLQSRGVINEKLVNELLKPLLLNLLLIVEFISMATAAISVMIMDVSFLESGNEYLDFWVNSGVESVITSIIVLVLNVILFLFTKKHYPNELLEIYYRIEKNKKDEAVKVKEKVENTECIEVFEENT
ncbi:hypothetical protein J0677_20600 [Vibrio parahaemolyticus]|uniref:hypothetical protein n=1 Tax=Vibrio parahaemolyticus TaxID=670 RepID=UPI001A90C80D|nr:hypothetical protein [Vibrio parahaemolyticus]MBO0190196.1 hypothetical protein [Vibrio parahaemolyticus]MBO0190243.1 hypothetical protein [Vibrio parahaemolyticus]